MSAQERPLYRVQVQKYSSNFWQCVESSLPSKIFCGGPENACRGHLSANVGLEIVEYSIESLALRMSNKGSESTVEASIEAVREPIEAIISLLGLKDERGFVKKYWKSIE
jgi:hypothetical protein